MKKLFLSGIILALWLIPVLAEVPLGLAVGTTAPNFQAKTYQGFDVNLKKVNMEGPVVLVFYRGGWCPYCNRQLQDFQSRLEDFKKFGATLIAVSVDLQEKAAQTVEENKLGFEVVSDPDASLLELYGLVFKVPDDLAAKYKNEYKIDLEASSGRRDHVIAAPATYVIDENGVIAYANVSTDYKVRPATDDILAALAKLNQ